jgi:hypothetical protein
MEELQHAGVYDTAEDGSIYSRRMIRDENLRQIRANGGKLGGNPNLKPKDKVNLEDNQKDKQKPTPSSSSSSSSSEKKDIATIVATPDGVSSEVWGQFVKQRKNKGAQITERVMKEIQTQAEKANWTLEMALTEVVVRNWVSFKADWVLEKQTATQKAQANMNLLTRGMTAPKPAEFWVKTATLEVIHDEPKRIL